MKKVNKEYKEAYKVYLEKLKNRPHKWGKGKCLVCNDKFQKTNHKHLYCSNVCRRINFIKNELDIKRKNESYRNSLSNNYNSTKSSSKEWYSRPEFAVFMGKMIYEKIMKEKQDKTE